MNIHNYHKLCPAAVRLYQYFTQRTKVYKVRNVNSQIKLPMFVKINLSFGLIWAFIWPVKKREAIITEPKVEVPVEIIKIADELFENGHYEECYNVLKEANGEVQNVELLWRMSRVLYNMSKQTKYDSGQRKNFVYEAYIIISDQLERHSNNFAVQKWYALLLDAKSSYEGVSERIRQLENVKKHMDLAVTINPDDATTLFMLGEWCYQVTGMPWHQRKIAEVLFATPPTSTYEDALEYFLRAEAAQPRFYSLNLLRLGSCYLKLEKEDQAKYYLKLAASYPAKSNDDHLANKEAAELLKKMKW